MVTQNIDLFTIPNAGPTGAPVYGTASFAALPTASLNFDRGFDVGLGIDLSAKVGAELRDVLYAALGGGISGSLGIQATVGFPLDLFSSPGGGFAMRFRGQAEAAGYLRADIGLDTAVFATLLRKAAPGPVTDLVSTFLDHVVISAGIWAHAGVTAQVDAQTYCTGRIWPPEDAGFSVVVKFAAGWYYGYGLSYVTNFRITDPAGMLDRLATQISGLACDAANNWVGTLTANTPEERAARAALPYVELLLPAFTRCLFTIGVQLADKSTTESHRQDAVDSVVASFLAESRKLVLNAAIDIAARAVRDTIGAVHIIDKVANLTLEQKAQVLGALEALRGDAWALTRPHMSAGDILDGITDCLVPLQTLLDLDVFGDAQDDLEEALGLMWAGAAVMRHVAGWVDHPATEVIDLLQDTTLVSPLPGGPVAAWLASRVPGKSAGTGFSIADVVTVLVNASPLRQAQLSPELDALLTWMRQVLGVGTGDLIAGLLRGQVQDGGDATAQIVDRLAQMGAEVIRDKVLPDLLTKIPATGDPAIRTLLTEVVIPALLGTPVEILPALADLGTSETAKHVREAASALLIQIFIDMIIESTDIVLNEALTLAPPWIDEVADQIRDLGEKYPAYSVLLSTAAVAATGVDLLPSDVAELLQLSARAMTLWDDHQRDAAIRLLREVMRLRLGDPATRDDTLRAYLDSNKAPNPAEMGRAISDLADGMWLLIRELMPAALMLLPHHFEHQLDALAAAAEEAFIEGLAEAKKFIENFPQMAHEWEQKLQELARNIATWASHVADLILALPGQLLDLEGHLLDRVDAEVERMIGSFTAGYPEPIPTLARTAFEVAFVPLRWQLEAPLALLASTGDLLQQTAAAQLATGRVDLASLRVSLRARILGHGMSTLRAPLVVDAGPLGRIDLGTVVLSDSWLRSVVADIVLSHPAVISTMDQVSAGLLQQRRAQAAQLAAARSKAELITKDQAAEKLTKVGTNDSPAIVIHNPVDGVARLDKIRIDLSVGSINRTFIEPPFGAPQRLLIKLNGQRIATDPGWWVDEGGMQFLSVTVLPSPAKAFPVLGFPQGPFYVEGQPEAPGTLHTFEARSWREATVVGRAGLNTLEVVAVDGAGHKATELRRFYFGPAPVSTILIANTNLAPDDEVRAYRTDREGTPRYIGSYPGIGRGTTSAVPITIGNGQQPGVVLVGDEVITVLNAFTGEHLERPPDPTTDPLRTAVVTSGFVKDPHRCDVVAVSPDTDEFRLYTADDEQGVLLDSGLMTGPLSGTVAATTLRPPGQPIDWIVLLKSDRVTCVRMDNNGINVRAELGLPNRSWTSIVAGRFTTTGAPAVLAYAASTGTWQIVTFDGALALGDSGTPGSHIDALPPGVTDLVPGQFGGDGLTDLLLWKGGSVEGSIVATSGSYGFRVLEPTWTDWQMSNFACPVAVLGASSPGG